MKSSCQIITMGACSLDFFAEWMAVWKFEELSCPGSRSRPPCRPNPSKCKLQVSLPLPQAMVSSSRGMRAGQARLSSVS